MRIPYINILFGAFILLCIILFCNLNGFVYLLFKISAPFSPLILLLCLFIIFISVFKLRKKLGSNLLGLITTFYILYISIGLSGYLFDDSYLYGNTSIPKLLRSYISSIIIITAFYIGAKSFIQHGKISYLIGGVFVCTLISALVVSLSPVLGLQTIIAKADIVGINPDRQTGLFADPNEAGVFGIYFLVISLSAYGYFKRGSIFFIFSFLLGLYITFSSFSRASMIVSIFILIVYIIFNLKYIKRFRFSNSKRPLLIGTFLLVGSIIVFQQFFTYVQDLSYGQRKRLMQTFELFSGRVDSQTTSYRSELVKFAWGEIKKRPVTGYGLGTFHSMKNYPGLNKMGVHNTQLMVWGEAGILAFFTFCLFYILLGLAGWTHYYPSLGFFIVGVCLTYFLNVSGSSHNALDDRTSNALVGIAIALSQIKKPKKILHKPVIQ